MTALQEKIFEIMKVFDKVCREQNISYYMLGGTMLGAVRHKGMIPWDDDADFGVPRKDYERLLSLPDICFPEGYRLRHFSKEKGVPYAFARLEDERTTLIEARRSGTGYVGGVYIDIFPLDADSNFGSLRAWKEFRVKLTKKFLYAHIAQEGAVKNPVKREIVKVVVTCTEKEKLVRRLDKLIKADSARFEKGFLRGEERFSNYLGHWGRRESIPRRIFDGECCEYEFEGYRFYGPADEIAYLTALYGSQYMLPPKEELRVGHPATVIELNQSYHEIEGK